VFTYDNWQRTVVLLMILLVFCVIKNCKLIILNMYWFWWRRLMCLIIILNYIDICISTFWKYVDFVLMALKPLLNFPLERVAYGLVIWLENVNTTISKENHFNNLYKNVLVFYLKKKNTYFFLMYTMCFICDGRLGTSLIHM